MHPEACLEGSGLGINVLKHVVHAGQEDRRFEFRLQKDTGCIQGPAIAVRDMLLQVVAIVTVCNPRVKD